MNNFQEFELLRIIIKYTMTIIILGLGLWCLMPLSTICQLYCDGGIILNKECDYLYVNGHVYWITCI